MSVEVTFWIYVDGETCLNEYVITAELDQYRVRLEDIINERHTGYIVIASSAISDNKIEVNDDVEYVVQELCFLAIADLLNHKSVNISYFTSHGYLKLEPEGELIHISGKYIPNAEFFSAELLPALYHCGLRYIDLLRRLIKDKPYYESYIARLETHAELARQALEKAGLL